MNTVKAIIFHYFLKRSFDDTIVSIPYTTFDFLGDIGDFCTIDGVGYIIEDYATEVVYAED